MDLTELPLLLILSANELVLSAYLIKRKCTNSYIDGMGTDRGVSLGNNREVLENFRNLTGVIFTQSEREYSQEQTWSVEFHAVFVLLLYRSYSMSFLVK